MKNKLMLLTVISTTGLILGLTNNVREVETYTSIEASSYVITKPTTNIDLNDTNESEIRAYYSSLNSLSDNEASGTNLLKNLKPILKNGQQYLKYTASADTEVWQVYEISDRDWEKSPASEISGYDPTTNTITGYTYGKSTSNPGTDPYVHALYVNRDKENGSKAWSDHSQKNYGINQEHVWPKSLGFEDDNYPVGARGDVMHLISGNGRVNGQYHKNYYYGYVDTTKEYNDAGSDYDYLAGNLLGYSKTFGGTVKVFEPQDDDKGDIARAIFYMMARYNYLSGSDSDGIDSGNPNLEIVNDITSWKNEGYVSTTSTTGKNGILQDLLEWNKLDPVDQYEIHRNNLLFNNYTKNRNPFIDFPEWADAIWGTSVNGVYDPTIKGRAKPATDVLNDANIVISKMSVSIKPEEEIKIKGTSIDESDITWKVVDSTIASIDKTTTHSGEEITVKGLKEGSTKVIAEVTIGGEKFTKECLVIVRADKSFKLDTKTIIIIAAIAAVVVIVGIVVLATSSKARKKAQKYVKKQAKNYVKQSTKSSSKKSNSSSSKKKK